MRHSNPHSVLSGELTLTIRKISILTAQITQSGPCSLEGA